MAAETALAEKKGISQDNLAKLKAAFTSETKNLLAQNVCSRYDVLDVCFKASALQKDNHIFNFKVNTEAKPVTNQKSSGRCWIFAILNAIRQQFVRNKNIDSFEFSQMNLYFWDKIERAYYLLSVYEEVARTEDCDDSRTMMFLMTDPSCDGGQWDMLVNLITKYGLMPKSAWPDAYSAQNSRRMNTIINSKMRSFAKRIVDLVKDKVSAEKMEEVKQEMLSEIYNVVSICLGTPPETFTWEYYDSSKKYCKVEGITPLEFYENHVKPIYNVEDKICIVNDPRPKHSYDQLYTVKYLGNMIGHKTVYLNQPIDVLKSLTVASLKSNELVWFGCDVGKHFDRKQGLLSTDIHDYELTFNISMPTLNKSDRLLFGESLMTHAMVISAVSVDVSIVNDPRAKHSFRNMIRLKKLYPNQPIDVLKSLTFASLKSNEEPMEKKEESDKQEEKQDIKTEPTEETQAEIKKPDDKTVVLHPVKTTKWRVENSWGDDKGDKGYLMMSDQWFSEFVYEVVVDKKFVPEEILKVLEQDPVILPPWDPMGALACRNCIKL